jgi:flagellar assembly factor FliW
MLTKTKFFGEVNLDDSKVLTFDEGILGFEDYKRWAILYDEEEKQDSTINWLQSLDEVNVAIPIVNPFVLVPDYNPVVNDDYLECLGDFKDEDLIVMNTITVPADVKQTTCNLRAPFIINLKNNKGVQIVTEGDEYPVRFNVYESVQKMKKEKGEI